MDQKDIQNDAGENNPVEKEVVYVKPTSVFDEGQIDLWQLILPLLRYKFQVILIAIAGLLIGIGYQVTRSENKIQIPISNERATFETSLSNLISSKQQNRRLLFQLIGNIEEGKKILQILRADFRYFMSYFPSEIILVKVNSLKGFTLDKLNGLALNRERLDSKNIDLILTVRTSTTTKLKNRLSSAYKQLFSIEKRRSDLIWQRGQQLLDGSGFDLIRTPKPPESEPSLHVGSIDAELASLTEIRRQLQEEIEFFHTSLTGPANVTLNSDRMPWKLWWVMKEEYASAEDNRLQEKIAGLSNTILSLNQQISSTRFLVFLARQKPENQQKIFSDLELRSLFNLESAPPRVSPRKVFVVIVGLSLFLGIISVYLRAFIVGLKGKASVKRHFQELFEALKSRKL